MDRFDFLPKAESYNSRNAFALAKAAQLAYRDKATVLLNLERWGFTQREFLSEADTQAFIAANADIVLVSFRGTEPSNLQDWFSDACIELVEGPRGKVHSGFDKALTDIWNPLLELASQYSQGEKFIWVTGHSLGAALATLAVARLLLEKDSSEIALKVQGLYTFGSPRVGDALFANDFDKVFRKQTFRFVNNNDVVPRVPLPSLYRHVGILEYFDKDGGRREDERFFTRVLDGLAGRIKDPGPDGITDHSMQGYLQNIEVVASLDRVLPLRPFEVLEQEFEHLRRIPLEERWRFLKEHLLEPDLLLHALRGSHSGLLQYLRQPPSDLDQLTPDTLPEVLNDLLSCQLSPTIPGLATQPKLRKKTENLFRLTLERSDLEYRNRLFLEDVFEDVFPKSLSRIDESGWIPEGGPQDDLKIEKSQLRGLSDFVQHLKNSKVTLMDCFEDFPARKLDQLTPESLLSFLNLLLTLRVNPGFELIAKGHNLREETRSLLRKNAEGSR